MMQAVVHVVLDCLNVTEHDGGHNRSKYLMAVDRVTMPI